MSSNCFQFYQHPKTYRLNLRKHQALTFRRLEEAEAGTSKYLILTLKKYEKINQLVR